MLRRCESALTRAMTSKMELLLGLVRHQAFVGNERGSERQITGSASEGGSLIVRIWRGVTPERVADSYLTHIQTTGIPAYRAIKGNSAVYVLRRVENGVAEFVVISLWNSWDAVQEFTKPADVNTAVYFDGDRLHLMFQEPRVAHYELALAADPLADGRENNPFEGTA
jgi:heme-degrading monooxygenase HmoA